VGWRFSWGLGGQCTFPIVIQVQLFSSIPMPRSQQNDAFIGKSFTYIFHLTCTQARERAYTHTAMRTLTTCVRTRALTHTLTERERAGEGEREGRGGERVRKRLRQTDRFQDPLLR
jgi:hypothetical protein